MDIWVECNCETPEANYEGTCSTGDVFTLAHLHFTNLFTRQRDHCTTTVIFVLAFVIPLTALTSRLNSPFGATLSSGCEADC